MMILIVILNLGALARRLLRRKPQEAALNDPEKRPPAETAQMARDVMRRMLESPPQTHEQMPKKQAKKKSKSRQK
jgi:hypothetical protein